jgi:hypothetical protein
MLLFLLGMGLFLYKVLYLGFPIQPGQQTNVWEIEFKINFTANDRPVKLLLYVPRNSRNFSIVNENFISKGYGISITSVEANRQVAWSIRRAQGKQTLYYRAMVEKAETEEQATTTKKIKIISTEYEGAGLEAAIAVLQEAKQKSADIVSLVMQLLELVDQVGTNDNVDLLLQGKVTLEMKIQTIINILAMENIPARLAHGVQITEQYGSVKPISWLEIYTDNQWLKIDPVLHQIGQLEDYLLIWKGSDRMVSLIGGQDLHVEINIKQTGIESLSAAAAREKIINPEFWKYSLINLPLDTQRVYAILLTVPVGVFLLVLLRNFIGIKTFGTFMPILIALAFRETQLITGLILFTILISVGLGIRFFLEKLKLLLVPRLASVLIIVILLMMFMSIVSQNLGIESGLSVALFPMVIITMTIERMSIVWEERGATDAMIQGAGSLITASLAFMVMSMKMVEHIVTVFPETLFMLLSLTLLMGRYSGYRLFELNRFKALGSK